MTIEQLARLQAYMIVANAILKNESNLESSKQWAKEGASLFALITEEKLNQPL